MEYQNNKSVRNEIKARLELLTVPYRIMRDGPSKSNPDAGYMIVDLFGRDALELEFGEDVMVEEKAEELAEEVPTKKEKETAKKKVAKKKAKKKATKKATIKAVD